MALLPNRAFALVFLGLMGAAPEGASTVVYYRAGAWEAFSSRSGPNEPGSPQNSGPNAGGTYCGIQTYDARNGRSLMIRHRIGTDKVMFRASKPAWSIPEGTAIAVSMQIGANAPWTLQGSGQGDTVEWSIPRDAMSAFDAQFRLSSALSIAFPSGNEPLWTAPLAGSNSIGLTLRRCIYELTARLAPTQPFASGEPARAAAGPTQPFSTATPADAAPAPGPR